MTEAVNRTTPVNVDRYRSEQSNGPPRRPRLCVFLGMATPIGLLQ